MEIKINTMEKINLENIIVIKGIKIKSEVKIDVKLEHYIKLLHLEWAIVDSKSWLPIVYCYS